ncbi:43589_t:CDS:2 [Gigaspora margarita]|uniref:43589_t:CDS:1 n=1 Tax=Gigaspora margarita TaxID=4874 RepID=A0ABM8W405_GIGMA|nr:43589_t:CDS:2 [Gigaspora margarita]
METNKQHSIQNSREFYKTLREVESDIEMVRSAEISIVHKSGPSTNETTVPEESNTPDDSFTENIQEELGEQVIRTDLLLNSNQLSLITGYLQLMMPYA